MKVRGMFYLVLQQCPPVSPTIQEAFSQSYLQGQQLKQYHIFTSMHILIIYDILVNRSYFHIQCNILVPLFQIYPEITLIQIILE